MPTRSVMADIFDLPRLASNTRVLRGAVLSLTSLMLILAVLASWPVLLSRLKPTNDNLNARAALLSISTEIATPSPSATPTAAGDTLNLPLPTGISTPVFPFEPLAESLVILAINEKSYSHLFAYQPGGFPLYRLTSGEWHDINPALSPDGKKIVFSSNRDGYWELYTLDLETGQPTRLTFSPEFDAHPSWSPDGLWIAYESYVPGEIGSNLEIFIRPVDGQQEAIRLTNEPAADHSPAWSPQGRRIAFVSNRSESDDIWLAELDKIDQRFENISRNNQGDESHPNWSPDGQRLVWTMSTADGLQNLFTWDFSHPEDRPRLVNNGSWAVWSPDGQALLSIISTPNLSYLTGYNLSFPSLALPILHLEGTPAGISWGKKGSQAAFPMLIDEAARVSPTPLWQEVLSENDQSFNGRVQLVSIDDVEPAGAMLQDRVNDSYSSLRERLAREVGWDFLAALDQTYMPLTAILGPGLKEDWAFTGRAIRFNPAPVTAGWMVVVREDYGPQTFWRIYLRCRFQDGTQGMPVRQPPWNFYTRLSGDPIAYEQGGKEEPIPFGYWLDFTQLALAYGWERQPAQSTWRLAISAARFDEYVNTGGLDWLSAMLEVYPREALNTATPIPSPTNTLIPTFTPTRTMTPTRFPTRTPTPTNTRWPTRTPVPPPTATPPANQAVHPH